MQRFLFGVFVNALALSAAAWLLPGIQLSGGFWDIVVVALVFGVVNALLKPLLLLLSLPFLLLTLGLFALVVNAVLLLLTAGLVGSFSVSGFGAALLGSIVISLVTLILGGAGDDS